MLRPIRHKSHGTSHTPKEKAEPSWLVSFLLCISSVLLLVLSFPHANWFVLAWIGLVPFLFSIDGKGWRRAFSRGYLFGFLFYLGTLWWIGYVTVIGMLLLMSYLALFFGVFAVYCSFALRISILARVFSIPALYVVLEFIRERALSGFGWSSLGHTQAAFGPIVQISSITGVAGVSFLVVLVNVVLWECARRLIERKPWERSLKAACAITWALLAAALLFGSIMLRFPATGSQIRVAAVQGNIPLGNLDELGGRKGVVEKYLAMSRGLVMQAPDLIIWPETAFPHFIWEQQELWEKVLGFSREAGVPLLVGAVTREEDQYFNSALLINGTEQEPSLYSKVHLVMFGEYIPLRKQLPFLSEIVPIDDFTPGKSQTLFSLRGRLFSVLICFEDTVPWLARQAARSGAGFFVNMTNDAWFKDSPGPVMHLYNSVFRAVENRRTLVRSTNTGVSALIDPFGRIDPVVSDRGRRLLVDGAMGGDITVGTAQTFYTKYGDVFTLLCALGILMASGAYVIGSRRMSHG